MIKLQLFTHIGADPLRCFDLSRDLDLHKRLFEHTQEEAIKGKTSGLIGFGEEVTWRAKHFGLFHLHTSRITGFDSPRFFRDEMTEGRFAVFVHDHFFEPTEGGTLMRDVLEFQSPLGLLGRVADRLVLKRYLQRFIETRNQALRQEAERG